MSRVASDSFFGPLLGTSPPSAVGHNMCRPIAVQCYWVIAIFAITVAGVPAINRHPVTVVVSFDGFRPDYIRPDTTPTMARFRDASAAPPYMRSAFPTKTFVNHFTIATGMHPETHGVLDNSMFDRNNETMHYTYEQFHYDDSLVPIWMQNEYNGEGRHSGVMMWPGSEFPYQGKYPTYTEVYNNSIHWNSRIDTIMSWIEDENRPANLVFAYFEEPDKTGHKKRSQLTRDKKTNHESRRYNDYVSNMTYKSVITGPNAFILPNIGKYDEVYTNLSNGANTSNKFYVFKKYQLPDRWYMKNNPRLNGIIYLLAKPGYAFWYSFFQKILDQTTKEMFRAGTHGYDNDDPIMHALFIASGPMFKRNFTAQPFDNVDLYPLISHLLALKQPTNKQVNGTIAGVEQLLTSSKSPIDVTSSPHILAVMTTTVIETIINIAERLLP